MKPGRKRVERSRQERDYADAVLDSLPGVFYHFDDESRLLRWNRNFESVTGYSAEDLLGMRSPDFFFEKDRELVASRVAEVFEKGASSVEADFRRKDGQALPHLFTGVRFERDGRQSFVGVGIDISQRRQAETALHGSLARFHAAARATGDVIWDWDLATDAIWWNENFQKLFGYSAEEIEPTIASWTSRLHPDDRDRVTAHIRAIVDGTGETWVDEYRFRRKDGGWAYLFDRGHVLRDAAGRGVRMVGAMQDITERKRAEEALRRSEERVRREHALLRAVIDNIPDHIFFKDADFAFLGCNPTFQSYYHRPESELIGKTDFDLLPAEWAGHYRELDRQIIASGEALRSEEDIPYEDGRIRTFDSIRVPFYDPEGGLLGLLGVGRDITDRKQMEEALREKTALFEAQVESSLDGILVVDRHGNRLLQNQRWNAVWKIDPETAGPDAVPRAAFSIRQVKDPADFAVKVAWLEAHPEEISRDVFELVDGTILDRYSAPVLDREGRYYGRTWILRDITEERRREQRLREAEKMEAIGSFAAGVAHDFNNVLAVIRVHAELMARHRAPPEDNAPPILHATDRARDLVGQILDFATQRHMVREPMDLRSAVSEAVSLLRSSPARGGIVIEEHLPGRPARTSGNATQLLRLVLNLGKNALQAMSGAAAPDRAPATLTIRLEAGRVDEQLARAHPPLRPGPALVLTIGDTGPGMDAATQARIFEPFFSTKGAGGSGLGLALVHGIVAQHEGSVRVDSAPGAGTVFTIWLPMLPEAPAAATLRGRLGKRILVVDDEPGIAEVMAQMLTELGHFAEAFEDPIAARARIASSERFDLVIMDYGMLGPDGEAQADGARPRVPLILMGGDRLPAGLAEASGCEGFLTKPFTSRQLKESCAAVFGNR
ncbi:MAG: PAS domain S-box protein [Sphingomonas sp.]